ncbi:MAG: alpha/beta fold hydrolase [Minisyncoccia bacterium]
MVGNSFGGVIATAYAFTYPEKVRALFLVDSVMAKEYGVTPFVAKRRARHFKILRSRFVPLFFKKVLLCISRGTSLSMLSKDEVEKKTHMHEQKWELSVDYAKLTMPVFLVWGKKDTGVHPIARARKIAASLPNGTLIEYDGNVDTIYKQSKKIIPLI